MLNCSLNKIFKRFPSQNKNIKKFQNIESIKENQRDPEIRGKCYGILEWEIVTIVSWIRCSKKKSIIFPFNFMQK